MSQADRVLPIVLREMCAIGTGWRLDWSGFDGRTLRNQLDSLASWAKAALENPDLLEYTEGSDFLNKK